MNKKQSYFSNIALVVATICLGLASLMVFGSSLGLWDPIVGFSASRKYNNALGYISIAIALFSLLANVQYKQNRGILKSVIALILGVGILTPHIISLLQKPVRYPPIHDITTNTIEPPQFEFLTDNREGAKNSLVYGGEQVAKQQREAYPDIKPIISDLSVEMSYLDALAIANELGWEIVHGDPELFRFEATARTTYFNFSDDIVVQVSKQDAGSRIDVRSVSRVGRSDRGLNAKRIRDYAQQF